MKKTGLLLAEAGSTAGAECNLGLGVVDLTLK